MPLSGTDQLVKITLRNPLDHNDQLEYNIELFDNVLSLDWRDALKETLIAGNQLEKNYCFLGFPHTARNLEFLCDKLNQSIDVINNFFDDYKIQEIYIPETLRDGLDPNQDLMNHLHNHFECLQGTVENLSEYYRRADHETKYAIRQLNNICHETESLMLSLRKQATLPQWVRSSQITTFLQCRRYDLKEEHRQGFVTNGYDRRFGHVYMHWTQIGKTLFEVFRDEGAPELTDTICEAITHLKYYSGEFDVEWGNDVVYRQGCPWHDEEQDRFHSWLIKQGLDIKDPNLSLGYLPIGKVNLSTFGTDDPIEIRHILGRYLDIYKITVGQTEHIYPYCWSDSDYKEKQINQMRPGYDYTSSRR
jgi:hypothetical protein